MSRRPSFFAIKTSPFRKLLNDGDSDAKLPGKFRKEIDKIFDAESREKAFGIGEQILRGGHRVKAEDSDFAMVVYCLAQAQQKIKGGGGLFWESFLGGYAQWRESKPPLRYLFDGRPEIAHEFDSYWATYALLSPEEARSLFAQIRAIPDIEDTFDFEEADVWMDKIETKGLGVFFLAS